MCAITGVVKPSQYREDFKEVCWEAIHAYREGCLCKACFNYRCYREALAVVAKVLAILLTPPPSDDAENGVDPDPPDPQLKALHDFCALPSNSAVADAMVCAPCLQDADARCLRGECERCGFSKIWSKGLRRTLVYADGTLKPDISRVWLTRVQWDRVKTGGDGSSSEDDLRQQCEGTLIELLDELDPVQTTWLPHRYHITHAKVAAKEYDQHSVVGMIGDDSDYSENGKLVRKHELQREYWTIVYYTLMISISRFLIAAAWIERRKPLLTGAEVTVELEGASEPGSLEPGEGAYFAVVSRGSITPGEEIVYEVELSGGGNATVRRELLRHRRWHRIAFLQFTDDKQHDGWQSQAWFARRHKFFQIWHDSGRAAALEFARDDLAEKQCREERSKLEDASKARAASAKAAADAATAASLAQKAAEEASSSGAAGTAEESAAAAATAAADAADARLIAAAIAAVAAKPSVYDVPAPRALRQVPSDSEFKEWLAHLDEAKFWAWVGHADNAVHFKSKEMLHWWSTRLGKVDFIKAIWIEFGCPGHGKGPWDGLGAMVKTKITRDITNEQCRTPSGRIESPIEAAMHARATFSTDEWLREHAYMQIHEVVVMYASDAPLFKCRSN